MSWIRTLVYAFPILITLYVLENTTPEDYGPVSLQPPALDHSDHPPPVGGLIADMTGSSPLSFARSNEGLFG